MKHISALVYVLSFFLASCGSSEKESKEAQKTISHNTPAFNATVKTALGSYYDLSDRFVNWDSAALALKADQLYVHLENVKTGDLAAGVRDSAASAIQLAMRETKMIRDSGRLEQKRRSLNSLTQQLHNLLSVAAYDESRLYLQLCPMAFNDEEPGLWISAKDTILNPYLGKHHPRYRSGMLECGENKSVIDFTNKRIPAPKEDSGASK